MTCIEFNKRMELICRQRDLSAVKRDGMKLIIAELGAGVPGYLPALESFLKRLEYTHTNAAARVSLGDGIGGTDGSAGGG